MKQLSRLAALALSLVLLASCAAAPEEQKTNKKEEDVTVYAYPDVSLSSSLRTMTEKADIVVLGTYKKALDAEKEDSPNADSQSRDYSFQVKQVLKGEDVPKTITVSKGYSIRMTHRAEGQDIPYQMPFYTFTEPQMGETYLLFLKEGQNTYSLSSEPGEVRKDGSKACLSSHFFSEDPGTLPTLTAQAETDSTIYHIAVQSSNQQKKDFLSGMDWEEVVEEVQSLA